MKSINKIILNNADFLAAIQDYILHNGGRVLNVGAVIEVCSNDVVPSIITTVKDLIANPKQSFIYIVDEVDDIDLPNPSTFNTFFDVFDSNTTK